MEDNMISIAGGFQYSVNIDYDVGNAKKVASYVPTDAFVSLTSDVIDSLESNKRMNHGNCCNSIWNGSPT